MEESVFVSVFGSLKWNTGGGFQLVYEPEMVWLQTEEAEDDITGTSCPLPHVRTRDDAVALQRLLCGKT